MNVLVTGANGFVGSVLCAHLRETSISVRAVVRNPAAGDGKAVVVGDIGANTDWDPVLDGVDTVIHLAARVHIMRDPASNPLAAFRSVNLDGTAKLAEQARAAGVKRFVFVSSAKVHGEATLERPFTEDQKPQPQGAYAVSKWEAEQALVRIAANSMECVILRPPLVYGPHVRGNFLTLLKAVYRRWPLPLGAIDNRRSLLYIDNLVHAIACCAAHSAAAGKTFLVSDREDLSTPHLVRSLAAALDVPPRLIAVPPAWLRAAGAVTGRGAAIERLTGSLQLDSSRIARELRWSPPHTVSAGLEATARWYRQSAGAT